MHSLSSFETRFRKVRLAGVANATKGTANQKNFALAKLFRLVQKM
jgi:hypothetical protein